MKYLFLAFLIKLVTSQGHNSNRAVIKSRKTHAGPQHLKIGVLTEYGADNTKINEAIYAMRSTFSIIQDDPSILPDTELVIFEQNVPQANIFKALESACLLGQKGISGIIVVAECSMSLTLRAYAESMKIPTMVVHSCECSVEPSEERNLDQTIAITSSQTSNTKSASDIIMYGSYWYRMGAGYTKILNDCLATLIVQEAIRQVLFYTDGNSFPHRVVEKSNIFFNPK